MCVFIFASARLTSSLQLSVDLSREIFGSGGAPPPAVPYIYKFEDGDQELWLCHPVGSDELPKTFEGSETRVFSW